MKLEVNDNSCHFIECLTCSLHCDKNVDYFILKAQKACKYYKLYCHLKKQIKF